MTQLVVGRYPAPPRPSRPPGAVSTLVIGVTTAVALLLAGCATEEPPRTIVEPSPAVTRAMINRLLPANVPERAGWATDLYAAFTSLQIRANAENVCAAIAVTEQESSFRVDPSVPGLATIAWKEIDARAEQAGVPKLVVRTALRLDSPDGRSYSERIDAVQTEKQLSLIFDDFIGMVPLGKTYFADRNPIRTGGPMQVSIAYAQNHAATKPYPYPLTGTIRNEVFTRRGGLYFGIAHLLDYPVSYDQTLYRFADFNAGHYASRNAAFQNAVSVASGVPLSLDGDLIRYGDEAAKGPGATETATRVLADRLGMSGDAIHRDLELGKSLEFERSRLYGKVFALAEQRQGSPLPRAVLPKISLQSPKITRQLTTEWFANRVDERRKRCLARNDPQAG